MAYGDFKDLTRRTASDNTLHDKAFNIAKNPKQDGYQRVLLQCFIRFLIERQQVVLLKMTICQTKNQLRNYTNPLLENFKKEKYASLSQTIWGADLVNMQVISKFNTGICFSLYLTDIFSKYAWVILLKDKKVITVTNAFQKILNESN